ncbi:hypothetical protein GPECTOR_1g492 [Gonium pectorale]|uniref:SAM domain-containing protein n=1 Tax=Gonium pectorale TaxID=33097 RepID=A0A150H3Z7_GONPE|nr:hypothetical protein GPECTOR_1g492 [Gonium pectorale]|eukprot:KXZ56548.1 hypothetical protein GPECTOR_1g492 [Gonium pectorale]
MSLDANDAELSELLGDPQTRAAPAPPPPLPPRPPPPLPPPLAEPAGSISLGAEDSELAELLGEGSAARPLPPPPPPPAAPPLGRKISFAEPPAAPAVPPAAARRPGPVAPPSRPPADDFSDVDDAEEDFGLTADVDREVAQIASHSSRQSKAVGGGAAGPSVPAPQAAFRSPAPDDSLADDFGSEFAEEASLAGRRPSATRPPQPLPAPPRGTDGAPVARRLQPQDSVYSDDPYEDSFDSPGARDGRPRPRGIPPRGHGRASSEAGLGDYNDEYADSLYDSQDDGGEVTFRRVPAGDVQRTPPATGKRPQAPGPYDEEQYDDEYDDDDDFADDLSWDGEIRHTRGAYNAGGRPGSAGHPRSRGPHAQGTRRRPLSAMAPRERQAAMIEEMMGRHPSSWDIREVATWLEFIGMGQYRIKFVHHSVDGTLLLSLGEPELARDLRILPLGHRRALLGAIAELREAVEAGEKDRAERGLPPAAAVQAKTEAERLAQLRQQAGQGEAMRRPSSAGARVIPPEPYLGPAKGKMTVYEQRAKLLYQLDKARHRAAQHAA